MTLCARGTRTPEHSYLKLGAVLVQRAQLRANSGLTPREENASKLGRTIILSDCGLKRQALTWHWLPVVYFNCEAEVFDHPPDFRRWRARRREIAIHKDGIGGIEG